MDYLVEEVQLSIRLRPRIRNIVQLLLQESIWVFREGKALRETQLQMRLENVYYNSI